jgi:hypothetical protein
MLFRCQEIIKDTSGKHFPRHWECDPAFAWFHKHGASSDKEDTSGGTASSSTVNTALECSSVQDSLILMKFFPLSSTVATALCYIKQGSSLELLFKLNSEETRIVEYPK